MANEFARHWPLKAAKARRGYPARRGGLSSAFGLEERVLPATAGLHSFHKWCRRGQRVHVWTEKPSPQSPVTDRRSVRGASILVLLRPPTLTPRSMEMTMGMAASTDLNLLNPAQGWQCGPAVIRAIQIHVRYAILPCLQVTCEITARERRHACQ